MDTKCPHPGPLPSDGRGRNRPDSCEVEIEIQLAAAGRNPGSGWDLPWLRPVWIIASICQQKRLGSLAAGGFGAGGVTVTRLSALAGSFCGRIFGEFLTARDRGHDPGDRYGQ